MERKWGLEERLLPFSREGEGVAAEVKIRRSTLAPSPNVESFVPGIFSVIRNSRGRKDETERERITVGRSGGGGRRTRKKCLE